jgi:SprT-like protein
MFMMNSGSKQPKLLMNDQKLQCLTERIANEFFAFPFTHRIYFNQRLKTTGGRYLLANHNIEINPQVLNYGGQTLLVGVIKHELCHYQLHLQKKDATHRSASFRLLLKKVGGIRFVPRLVEPRHQYLYCCQNCGQQYQRQRKINPQRLVCGRCVGRLKLIKAG